MGRRIMTTFYIKAQHLDEILLMEEILHQLRLLVYPIIYDGFYTSQVVFSPDFHQQYLYLYELIPLAVQRPQVLCTKFGGT